MTQTTVSNSQSKATQPTLTNTLLWRLQLGLTQREKRLLQDQLLFQAPAASQNLLIERGLSRCSHATLPADTEIISQPEWISKHGKLPVLGCPLALQVCRPAPSFTQKSIAIVGSRHPTFAGRQRCAKLARDLAKLGFFVWSGAAIGIDTVALRAALSESVAAGAVVGGGLACPHPASNRSLFSHPQLCLVSQFATHERARPFHFPQRNFTLAWLADYVLVVEAQENSGSLITAHHGAALGKGVGALSWPEGHPLRSGTEELISLGADPIQDTTSLLRHLADDCKTQARSPEKL